MTTQIPLARPSGALHISLRIAQVLLAVLFAFTGVTKLVTPVAQLHTLLPWTLDVSTWLLRLIGVAEVLGALGVILPALTRVRPMLTPLAAAGLILVMLLATGFHLLRGEAAATPVNLALLLLAAFVAWGRSRAAPIPPRV